MFTGDNEENSSKCSWESWVLTRFKISKCYHAVLKEILLLAQL